MYLSTSPDSTSPHCISIQERTSCSLSCGEGGPRPQCEEVGTVSNSFSEKGPSPSHLLMCFCGSPNTVKCKMANFNECDILATFAKGVFSSFSAQIEILHVQYSTSDILFLNSETRIDKIFHRENGPDSENAKKTRYNYPLFS